MNELHIILSFSLLTTAVCFWFAVSYLQIMVNRRVYRNGLKNSIKYIKSCNYKPEDEIALLLIYADRMNKILSDDQLKLLEKYLFKDHSIDLIVN